MRSTVDPDRYYTDVATDVAARLEVHNSGGSSHTLLSIQSRYEMDAFLKARGVFLDLTLEDV